MSTITLFTKEQATKLVNELNANEYDDWTYKVIEDPKGTSKWCNISIFDENGEFVGKM